MIINIDNIFTQWFRPTQDIGSHVVAPLGYTSDNLFHRCTALLAWHFNINGSDEVKQQFESDKLPVLTHYITENGLT